MPWQVVVPQQQSLSELRPLEAEERWQDMRQLEGVGHWGLLDTDREGVGHFDQEAGQVEPAAVAELEPPLPVVGAVGGDL